MNTHGINTYSFFNPHRALESDAIQARKDIESLVNILSFYKAMNPHILIVIENPVGFLRLHPVSNLFSSILNLEMVTISYCKFSTRNQFFPKKDTNLWTNSPSLLSKFSNDQFKCMPKSPCQAQDKRKHFSMVQDLSDRCSRYPTTLCNLIAPLLAADVVEATLLGNG